MPQWVLGDTGSARYHAVFLFNSTAPPPRAGTHSSAIEISPLPNRQYKDDDRHQWRSDTSPLAHAHPIECTLQMTQSTSNCRK
jgi:hypothetical protein